MHFRRVMSRVGKFVEVLKRRSHDMARDLQAGSAVELHPMRRRVDYSVHPANALLLYLQIVHIYSRLVWHGQGGLTTGLNSTLPGFLGYRVGGHTSFPRPLTPRRVRDRAIQAG